MWFSHNERIFGLKEVLKMAFKIGKKGGPAVGEAPADAVKGEAEAELAVFEETGFFDDELNTKDKQIDIEVESSIQKQKLILYLTWPSLAENVFTSVMSMVDMMMVGSLGAYAISSVGLVTQPKFIMMAAFMAMNVGTTALVAQFKGARNPERANASLNQALILCVFMVAIVCGATALTSEALIRFIAGTELSDRIMSEGLRYYRIQIYGFPLTALTFTMNAALRGAGNVKATFYNNSVANVVNVVLNYCLIFGRFGLPRMEVAGASLATVIGQGVAFVMALFVLAGGKQYIRLKVLQKWSVDFALMKRVVNIGVPAFIEQIIMRVGALWFTTIVTALGDIAYATHMVAMNIQMLAFTTGMAFGTAATTLVGQSIGRKRIDLAKVYVRMTQMQGLIVSIVIAVFMFTCGRFISRLYSDDLSIISLAADMLKIIAIVNPIMNARFIYTSALRGAGDSKSAAIVTFIGVLIVRPVVAMLLVNILGMGLTGVWIALSSDFVISFFVIMLRYRRGKWMELKI